MARRHTFSVASMGGQADSRPHHRSTRSLKSASAFYVYNLTLLRRQTSLPAPSTLARLLAVKKEGEGGTQSFAHGLWQPASFSSVERRPKLRPSYDSV